MNARVRWTVPVVLGLLAAAGCDRGEPGRVPAPAQVAEVEASHPLTGRTSSTVPGTVRSTREADVATRVSGTVREVRVDVGDAVGQGAVIARLDDADVLARVRSAEAQAERARAYHRRIAALEQDGAATRQELDDAAAGLAAAEAGLDAARAQTEYVTIRAAFGGVVTARHVDPGDLAVPGMPVVTLVRPGSVEIEADLPADRVRDLAAGQRVDVEAPSGETLPAVVRSVSPALDRQSRRARVKLDFAAEVTAPPAAGSYVRLRLPGEGAAGVWVPADALVIRGQLVGVYLVEEDHLRLRWVRVGERTGDGTGVVEVLAGLEPDDLVVRRPRPALVDGARVGSVRRVEPGADGSAASGGGSGGGADTGPGDGREPGEALR
jgi:RND family efflux transporter MFP subunit